MNDTLKKIGEIGIIPVIKIEDASKAVPLAEALSRGGLPAAEVTFRTAAAADAIRAVTEAMPDMLVGAGTVLTTEQVDRAADAGAKFIVSPGFNPKIVKYCIEKGIPVCPGCSTCGEMEQAMELGLDVVKFFPAEAAGGLSVIKAVSAPYGNLKFMPTGGINEENILSYLKFPKILACGGSFMVKDALIKEGNFAEIERLTREAVAIMHGFEIVHVRRNEENRGNALPALPPHPRRALQSDFRRHKIRGHGNALPRQKRTYRHRLQLSRPRKSLSRASRRGVQRIHGGL